MPIRVGAAVGACAHFAGIDGISVLVLAGAHYGLPLAGRRLAMACRGWYPRPVYAGRRGGGLWRLPDCPQNRWTLQAPLPTCLSSFHLSVRRLCLTRSMPPAVRAFAENQPVTSIGRCYPFTARGQPVGNDIWVALDSMVPGILIVAYVFAMRLKYVKRHRHCGSRTCVQWLFLLKPLPLFLHG